MLFAAYRSGNESLVKYLEEKHGVDINETNIYEPLFYVCESENESLVKYLIEHGADVNKEDEHGGTPLFDACEFGNESVVKYLEEEHGVNINKENKYEETPLDLAYYSNYSNIIGYLEEKGAVRGEIEQFSRYSDDSSKESESSGDESAEFDVTLD